MNPAAAPTFDLQSHSLHSDGELSATEVVTRAADAGVELLALTDHDSVAGVAEARAAAAATGIRVVSAVEISVLDGDSQDLHLLGYGVDVNDARLGALLADARGDREARAERMVARLTELGWALDTAHLSARADAGLTIGRPHLAEMVVAHPANAERLAREGVDEPSSFLVAYLIEGTPGFVPRAAPSVETAIELVHGAGGLAVWAHPFWDISLSTTVLDTLARFRTLGLDGVEAFYVTHTREQTTALYERARALDLLTTGSTDFHGPGHATFHRFRGFSTYGLEPVLGPLAD